MVVGSQKTAEIWSLTLEIIRQLTGERYPDEKSGDHVTITVSPPPTLKPNRHALRKILEVTRKITELLIGEMEFPQELSMEVKAENKAEHQVEAESEAGCSGAGGDLKSDVMTKVSAVTPVGSPLVECGVGSAAGETGQSSEEPCEEDDSSHMIGEDPGDAVINVKPAEEKKVSVKVKEEEDLNISPDGRYRWNNEEEDATFMSYEREEDDLTAEFADLSSYPSTSPFMHIEKVLIGERPYSCSQCGKCYARKSHLITHGKVHTGDKPFSCYECGKCFSDKSSLIKHERVHTGEKPYKCPVCGKCFSQTSNLIRHERVHTGEKRYSCLICEKSFSDKSALIKHERLHTGEKPFSCSECGKRFSDKSDLTKHERIHKGERPYLCLVCGKCFSQKSNLITHEKVHTRHKPYSCSYCGKGFSQMAALSKHERFHVMQHSNFG